MTNEIKIDTSTLEQFLLAPNNNRERGQQINVADWLSTVLVPQRPTEETQQKPFRKLL